MDIVISVYSMSNIDTSCFVNEEERKRLRVLACGEQFLGNKLLLKFTACFSFCGNEFPYFLTLLFIRPFICFC